MDPLGYLLAAGLFASVALWRLGRDRDHAARVPEVLGQAARQLGLEQAKDQWWRGEEVWRGELEGVPIELAWRVRRGQFSADGALEVRCAGVPLDLLIRASAEGRVDRSNTADLTTGDDAFDAALQVAGDPTWLRPRLDSDLRGELLTLTRDGGRVSEGFVGFAHAEASTLSALLGRARLAVAVRRSLDPRRDAPSLADLARTDPVAGVRREAALALRGSAPGSFRALVPDLMKDRAVRVRALGVAFLAESGPLRRLLASTVDEVALMDGLTAVRALRVAGTEPAVIALLGHTAARVRRAAAEALGEVGRGASIGPLRRLAEPVLEAAEVRAAARAALQQVEARVGPEGQGRVSLADGAGTGAVTLPAEAASGKLSLKEPDDAD